MQRSGKGWEKRGKTHSIPDLEFDVLVVHTDHTSSEFDTNREIVNWLELVICELQQKA